MGRAQLLAASCNTTMDGCELNSKTGFFVYAQQGGEGVFMGDLQDETWMSCLGFPHARYEIST
jgi:hypothetical protein